MIDLPRRDPSGHLAMDMERRVRHPTDLARDEVRRAYRIFRAETSAPALEALLAALEAQERAYPDEQLEETLP